MNRSGAWLFVAWLVAVLATSGSLFLSEVWGYTPCELCWYQRIFMYPLMFVIGIASYKQKTVIIPYVAPLILVGGSISIYHIVIQKLPKDSTIAACGPTSCLDDYLNWFGWLTIPMLALAAFILIAIALHQAGDWTEAGTELTMPDPNCFRMTAGMALSLAVLAVALHVLLPPPVATYARIPQEPIYWHVMGADAHMSLRIKDDGGSGTGQRVRIDVWLPEGMGAPAAVELALLRDGDRTAVPLAFKEGGPDPYGFEGFDKYTYEASGSYIADTGQWEMKVEVTDAENNRYSYDKRETIN